MRLGVAGLILASIVAFILYLTGPLSREAVGAIILETVPPIRVYAALPYASFKINLRRLVTKSELRDALIVFDREGTHGDYYAGFRKTDSNRTHRGLWQQWTGHGTVSRSPWEQTIWAWHYMLGRYGTWRRARRFHEAHNYW